MKPEDQIREQGRRLGFIAVGFAEAGPCESFPRFQEWLNRGYAGTMTYLSRLAAQRSHPRELLSEAKSVIVVAARYPSSAGTPFYSRYALGADYHGVIRRKLKQLVRAVDEQQTAPIRARICIDSAPLLEREWAVRAGIGWIGRQGSIVHPDYGCCLFLGAVITDLELESSPRVVRSCGSCRACVEACPTGAIQADGLVDARRCIAYLTIEHKGPIPETMRPFLQTSLFGCDRCTSACPLNRKGEGDVMAEFRDLGRPWPTPEHCLTLDEASFRQMFRDTPVLRVGLAGLRRNAAVTLGLDDPEPEPGANE